MEDRRRASLPDMWGVPPERGVDYYMDRLHFKVEGLELEVRNLTRQMDEMLRSHNRNQEGEWSRNLLREITLPSFSGEDHEDAAEFLRDIEQYLLIKRIPENFQAKIISNACIHRAKIWFNAVRGQLNNFNDFRDKFIQEFLSDEMQERAKETWKAEKYRSGNLVNYFYLRVGEANRFVTPFTEYQRNRIIVSQLPHDIQIAMIGIDLANSHDIVRALTRADETRARTRNAPSENENKGLYSRRVYSTDTNNSNLQLSRPDNFSYNNRGFRNNSQNNNFNRRFESYNSRNNQQDARGYQNYKNNRREDSQGNNYSSANNNKNYNTKVTSATRIDNDNLRESQTNKINEITTIAEIHEDTPREFCPENSRAARM